MSGLKKNNKIKKKTNKTKDSHKRGKEEVKESEKGGGRVRK